MHSVFVYGTLKQGFQNHSPYMDGLECLGRYQTVEAFPLVTWGRYHVPCLINKPGEGHRIWGELYLVPDNKLPAMDYLEETHAPDGYRRVKTMVVPKGDKTDMGDKGDQVEAFIYLRAHEHVTDIRSEPVAEYAFDPTYIAPAAR